MNTTLLKYINTILLGICAFLLTNMYLDFKNLIKDVTDLKIIVSKHEYILSKKEVASYINQHKEDNSGLLTLFQIEGILPNDKTKVKDDSRKNQGA